MFSDPEAPPGVRACYPARARPGKSRLSGSRVARQGGPKDRSCSEEL